MLCQQCVATMCNLKNNRLFDSWGILLPRILRQGIVEERHDADILSLTQRVTYTIDARDGTPHFGGRVIVTHSDGRSMTRDEPVPRGSSGNKISLESIAEKFMANTSLVMSYEDSERTMHEILELDHAPDAARLLNHLQKKA